MFKNITPAMNVFETSATGYASPALDPSNFKVNTPTTGGIAGFLSGVFNNMFSSASVSPKTSIQPQPSATISTAEYINNMNNVKPNPITHPNNIPPINPSANIIFNTNVKNNTMDDSTINTTNANKNNTVINVINLGGTTTIVNNISTKINSTTTSTAIVTPSNTIPSETSHQPSKPV